MVFWTKLDETDKTPLTPISWASNKEIDEEAADVQAF